MKCRFCNCLLTGTEEQEGICYDCTDDEYYEDGKDQFDDDDCDWVEE